MLSLLSEEHKYLTQVCVKGMKESGYTRVREWYNLITQNVVHLAILLSSDSTALGGDQNKNLFKTLNILKVGFYSEDMEVSRLCSNFFTQLMI